MREGVVAGSKCPDHDGPEGQAGVTPSLAVKCGEGEGCTFTAQAFGDLDDDGEYSTFERSGAADQNGINAAAGMFISV